MPLIPFPPVRLTGTALAVVAAMAVLQACSVDEGLTPPGAVAEFAPQPAPVLMPEPQAPATYPLAEPVSAAGMAVAPAVSDVATAPETYASSGLPEGQVSVPVVGGIGSDAPVEIASVPSEPGIDAAQTAALAPASAESRSIVDTLEPAPQAQPKYAFVPRLTNPAAAPEWAGGMPAAERTCRQQLKRLGVKFRDLPPIGKGTGCSIPYPVEMTELSGGIKIKPAAKLNCQITAAFASWVKNELAPAARTRYLSGIASINQLSSYSCRTMNSRAGAPMSEHARGNAIDVGKITLNSGKVIAVRQPGFFAFREKSLLTNVRADSCKYFTTVLGPGSDVYHKDHFHFDLRKRRTGYRHCD
mgnify:CR=1 FL=1|jgi:Uncharacterized protein conserved in bacteria